MGPRGCFQIDAAPQFHKKLSPSPVSNSLNRLIHCIRNSLCFLWSKALSMVFILEHPSPPLPPSVLTVATRILSLKFFCAVLNKKSENLEHHDRCLSFNCHAGGCVSNFLTGVSLGELIKTKRKKSCCDLKVQTFYGRLEWYLKKVYDA